MKFAEFTVHPTLDPSSKERQREYYLRMERHEDRSDDIIYGLEGDVILCSAADCDDRNDELRSSHNSLDPATILRDWQTHGPTPTFSTPVGPQMHGAMPTTLTPSLESLMHYIDHRIGEHQTYMKSMLANHKAAIVQKMETTNKAIMHKIESAMAMNKEACSGGVNVEFEQQLSRGIETRYNGGDNFKCQ
ncbi:hypothetical protein TIFTF001_030654 [Ficus carica]|uniref:Uncharacterized protein n=1 Tax=Ficus carica TaxID=3494 RepID=A0AA88DUJ8_FICCA|nr:hypothetical protein TIFTF001_030654 [Ficus carica]